ncbi:MAG TPA: thiamine pyrophosphate-binding protein [Burkholderiaceae bacterium]|nr:thiamine pyrophosphate-binding protein [Burkholderiaceae bacterium]
MVKRDTPVAGTTPAAMEWGSDVAAEMLRRCGIKYVALNPGASYRGFHDSLVNYLGNEDPAMLLCLHEDHVVSIAHGYAKVTDSPMGAVLHSNVGLMHGSMGIFNAYCDRMPMMVIGATGPVDAHKRRPWIDWIHTAKDQGALIRDFIKWDDEPRSAEGLVEAFWRGAQLTRSEPQAPVYICLDAGLQEARVTTPIRIPDAARYQPSQPACASEDQIEKLADMLLNARNPLLLFGRGSRRQQAWDNRVELAEMLGASVMTSIRDRAIFPTEHGLMAVPPVYWLNAKAKQLVSEADAILSLDWVDLRGVLKQVQDDVDGLKATLAHASLDNHLHRGWSMDYFGLPPLDLPLQASPDSVVEQLLAVVKKRLGGKRKWDGQNRNTAPQPEYSANSAKEIAPRDIEVALQRLRGNRAISLAHATYGWAGDIFHFRGPLDFLGSDGGAGLAAGPGLTVGIALALKDSGRLVVSVMGDGDFLQGATALWTAARYELPALIIVSNNRSNFNDEMHQEAVARARNRPVENRWIGQRIDDPAPDLAGIARAQGIEAEGPVTNVPDLERAILRGLEVVKGGASYFIDAHVATGYAIAPLTRGD